MTKRILILFIALGLSFQMTGCSSGDAKDDLDVAEANDDYFSEESDGDFADDAEFADTGESTGDGEVADSGEFAGDGEFTDDDFNLDGEGESQVADAAPADSAGEASLDDGLELDSGDGYDDFALDEPLPDEAAPLEPAAEPTQIAEEPAPFEMEPDTAIASEPSFAEPVEQYADTAPTDESLFTEKSSTGWEDTSSGTEAVGSYDPAPVQPSRTFIPVKKIRDSAYMAGDGTYLNRVYLGRPGDTVKSASQKIYGSNRSKDVLAWNPHLRNGIKTGDKLYYSSPNNPQDMSMRTYYEDIGAQPSVYVSQGGDNIRRVSKDLLGSSESWKEVWATNMDIESKGDIAPGLRITYWPEGVTGVSVAQSAPPAQQPQSAPPPPPPADTFAQSPPQDDFSMPEFQPPPPDMPLDPPGGDMFAGNGDMTGNPDEMAAAGSAAMVPPPPPPPEQAPPPPPEPRPVAKKAPAAAELSADPDQMMMLGFGGILLLASAVLYVVIRKNRAKHADLGQTQV